MKDFFSKFAEEILMVNLIFVQSLFSSNKECVKNSEFSLVS